MITEFQLMGDGGKVLARGEIDGDLYRVFLPEFPNGYKEFKNLTEMLAETGGNGIQPSLFETPARTRQLDLLTHTKGDSKDA